jgi:hypothetical protein
MATWISRINSAAGVEEGREERARTLPGTSTSAAEHQREDTKKRGLFTLGKKK